MEDEPRGHELAAARFREALGAVVNRERRIADLEIGEEREVALGLARDEAELNRVRNLVISMRQPLAIVDQRGQWRSG